MTRRSTDAALERRAHIGLVAAVAMLATSCGSTVTGGASSVGASGGSGLGTGSQGASTRATAPAGVGNAANAPTAGTGGPGATSTVQAQFGGVSGASGAPMPVTPSTASEPGVTASTMTVGVTYYQSAKAANEALGAKGIDTGDPVAAARTLIRAINEQGGVAGRALTALFYDIDPQSSTPYATEAQAECAYFTQDHKVFAVIDGSPAADARRCLAQHGVATLRGPIITPTLTGNEVDPYATRLDRAFTALVPALADQGWFSPWDRVNGQAGVTRAKTGIVTADDPEDNWAVDHVLIPALRQVGYTPDPADVIRITPPGGFSDDGATVAAIDNAALKLNADGVDHVILNDNNGSLSLLFNNYAYSQHYFPRYGGTSGNAWQVLLTAGDLPAKTLHGAMGIGWQPLFDLPYRGGGGPYANTARQRCFGLFHRAGMGQTDAASAGAQAEGCDVAFLLPAAFRGYRGPVNLTVFLQRVNALGTSYPLASGIASRFAVDQHDGNGAYAFMRFATGCTCIAYTSSARPIPR